MTRAHVSVANVVGGAEGPHPAPQPVSATESDTPRWQVVSGAVGAVALAAVVSWVLFTVFDPTPIKVSSSFVPLAGFLVVATALERLLQPVSLYFLNTDDAADPAQLTSEAAAAGADPAVGSAVVQAKVDEAAKAKAVLDRRKEERAIVYWAIASTIAMLVAGSFGFLLVASVASTPVNQFFDIVVTGLAIGAGTKPLHDLFTSIQAKSSSTSAS
ncbi:MAG TPA: hypothetical protein VMT43_14115 [Acidimicrobiales bacterium]|nr:hypothetical protein [Acidimicrobiales bacterium]